MEPPVSSASAPVRVSLLGQPVDLVTADEVLRFAGERIVAGAKGLVANHNLHSMHLVRRSPAMARFYAMADLIELDSMPLVAWGRLLGRGVARRHRCTYLDWREAFWAAAAARGWRVFYLGGAPGVAEEAARRLTARWPGVSVDTRHGYFLPEQNDEVLAQIDAFRPDVLFVGMGMPLQEAWIADNYARLARGVVFPVGAAFDYEAGVQRSAPRWMGRIGLEWLYRLAADPRRLAARYVLEPWSLLPAALADLRAGFARPKRGALAGAS